MIKTLVLSAALLASSTTFAAGVERLYGYTVGSDGVTVQVQSGGCTGKDSFTVKTMETSPAQVVIERKRDDFCEAYFPYGTTLTFSYAELGVSAGSTFVLSNPLMPIVAR